VPAEAGIQNCFIELDSRLRGNDKTAVLQQFLRGRPAAPAKLGPGVLPEASGASCRVRSA
jgi:hypothetical protein